MRTTGYIHANIEGRQKNEVTTVQEPMALDILFSKHNGPELQDGPQN